MTRARIRRAAMEVVARRGFDATVDEIAAVSGVSPRTIFRRYVSHDRLIAATVRDMFDVVGRWPVEGLPRPADDLEGWINGLPRDIDDLDAWLEKLTVTIHTRIAEIFGEAFWDIHGPSSLSSPALTETAQLRRRYRQRGVEFLTGLVWRAAGGRGDPPESLVLAFALNLSAFTTHALMTDFDRTPAQIGTLTADILRTLVRAAVDEQRSRGGPGAVGVGGGEGD